MFRRFHGGTPFIANTEPNVINSSDFFYYVPSKSATINFRCVALLYVLFIIELTQYTYICRPFPATPEKKAT